MAHPAISEEQMKKIKEIFDKYDNDKSGTIELSEFKNIMNELKVFEGELASYYEDTVFQSIDKDKNGKIDFNEFITLYSRLLKNKLAKQ